MAEFASKGVAGSGLGLGIAGTALALLGNGLGGLWGANGNGEGSFVNRYELTKENEIVRLETENALLKSNIYTDQKISDVYSRLAAQISNVENSVNSQAVYNAANTAAVATIQSQVSQLMGLTKMVVPADNVCPEPMSRYNSWTAPSSTATTT